MMPSLASIITNRKGRTNHWRVDDFTDDGHPKIYTLWHYSTPMLDWEDTGTGCNVNYLNIGMGTKSDQDGMNIAFRVLGLPYRYHRSNGYSRIQHLVTGAIWD